MLRRLAMILGALLCGLVGFTVAMALKVTVPGAKGGDWLVAGSGVVGVMLTVLVAVEIEEYRAHAHNRSDQALLRAAIDKLRQAIESAFTIGPEFTPERRLTSIDLQTKLKRATEQYMWVAGKVDVSDLALYEAIQDLSTTVIENRGWFTEGIDRLRAHGDNADVYTSNQGSLALMLTQMHPLAAHVSERLRKLR